MARDTLPVATFVPYVVVAVFGLAFGSFLNVCIFRLPREESILSPRSHCPRCNAPIRWYDNVPVVSYLVLGAKCRHCGQRISPVYPLVEILTAALLTVGYSRYGLSAEFIKAAALGMMLLVLIFTDLIKRRIPHSVTIFGIALGLILSFFVPVETRPLDWVLGRLGLYFASGFTSFLGALAGAIAGGGMFYAVGQAFYYLGGRKKEYLGFGDVMLMLMVGTFLGVPLTLTTILVGSLGGTLIAVPARLASPRFRDYEWPYGTFLGAAAIYSSLGGSTLLDWYLRTTGLA